MTDLTVIRGYALACGEAVDLAYEAWDAASAKLVAAREEFDRLHLLRHDPETPPDKRPSRYDLEAANDALVAARIDAATAGHRANEALKYAERVALYAAIAMGGDVPPESMATFAASVRALVGPIPCLEPEVAA